MTGSSRRTDALIRACDLTAAGLFLLFAAIPMTVIALIIRLGDGGPALFRQSRVGAGGTVFTIYKFRTMRVDDSGAGAGIAADDEELAEASARFQRTVPGDSRITGIGRFLRPSHLDELPQLFNVLRGDMSLVGVRPDTPVQEGDYTPEYWRLRHRYRPGLTGPAQLRHDALTFAERNAEESRWLTGRGFGMYCAILWRTFAKVLRSSSF